MTIKGFYQMDEIIRLHEGAGFYFFSEGAMKSFNSKIVENSDIKNHFITSEKFDKGYPRKFTIRKFNPDTKHIEDVSEFQEFSTVAKAFKALREITEGVEAK